jgi:hypothetical protein
VTGPGPPAWDILVATIPHRHARLLELLAALAPQMRPGVTVICCRDNLQLAYGDKCQVLMDASAAEYVSFADDDDLVAPGFIAAVQAALAGRPDYVGFPVTWTVDGAPQVPVEHSLRHGGWVNAADRLTRDIAHFNPVRRDLARQARWEGGYGADARWAAALRAAGCVRTEEWIPEPMYFYRYSAADNSALSRSPMAHPLPELPSWPWLTVLDRG